MNRKRLMMVIALVPTVAVLTSRLPAGPLDDQYKKLLETEKSLTATKSALQDQKTQLEQQRQNLIQQRKANAGLKKQMNQAAPTIDYSLYDRCPNGKSWDECTHPEEKAAWLRDQQDKVKVFQERMAKIQADFAAREKDINDSEQLLLITQELRSEEGGPQRRRAAAQDGDRRSPVVQQDTGRKGQGQVHPGQYEGGRLQGSGRHHEVQHLLGRLCQERPQGSAAPSTGR